MHQRRPNVPTPTWITFFVMAQTLSGWGCAGPWVWFQRWPTRLRPSSVVSKYTAFTGAETLAMSWWWPMPMADAVAGAAVMEAIADDDHAAALQDQPVFVAVMVMRVDAGALGIGHRIALVGDAGLVRDPEDAAARDILSPGSAEADELSGRPVAGDAPTVEARPVMHVEELAFLQDHGAAFTRDLGGAAGAEQTLLGRGELAGGCLAFAEFDDFERPERTPGGRRFLAAEERHGHLGTSWTKARGDGLRASDTVGSLPPETLPAAWPTAGNLRRQMGEVTAALIA